MTIDLTKNTTQPILNEPFVINQMELTADLSNKGYVYMGNSDVSESNYWQKIPGGGSIVGYNADLSGIFLFSPENASVTVDFTV